MDDNKRSAGLQSISCFPAVSAILPFRYTLQDLLA